MSTDQLPKPDIVAAAAGRVFRRYDRITTPLWSSEDDPWYRKHGRTDTIVPSGGVILAAFQHSADDVTSMTLIVGIPETEDALTETRAILDAREAELSVRLNEVYKREDAVAKLTKTAEETLTNGEKLLAKSTTAVADAEARAAKHERQAAAARSDREAALRQLSAITKTMQALVEADDTIARAARSALSADRLDLVMQILLRRDDIMTALEKLDDPIIHEPVPELVTTDLAEAPAADPPF